MSAARTRLRQVWEYLTSRARPEDEAWALGLLEPPAQALFQAMSRYDRYHGALVARRFSTLSPPPWALQAALLHDCGKGRFGLIARVLGVLFPDPRIPAEPRRRAPIRRIQQVYRWHGFYGATRAREAGLAEPACALVAAHHQRPTPPEIAWLTQFQAIDDD